MLKVCPQCERKYPEDIDYCAQDGVRLEELRDDQSDPLVGRVLDNRWVIEQRIGMGGMGAVYLGSQRSVDRKVAIKTLKPELSHSREFVERFFREARVASKISHPNSVTILDFGQASDDTLYLAMEFLEGMPLTTRLRQGGLKLREIIEICVQISSALAAAHAAQIIHRDLKPDNIYLLDISDESTFVKVLDFGIAKVIDAEEKMTQTGQVFGTPEYMSPEQCQGRDLDGRSDLYSLGCILYRMLVGRPPFESDTPMAVLISHVNQPPERVHELIERDDIPTALADLCMRLLEKDPEDRPANAQAVRTELEQILANTATGRSQTIDPSGEFAPPLVADQPQENDALAADGGTSAPQPLSPSPSAPQPHIARAPDGQTSYSQSVDLPAKKRGPLVWVLALMVVLVLGSGCALGIFMMVAPQDGQGVSGLLAGLFGNDNDEASEEDNLDPSELEEELAEADEPELLDDGAEPEEPEENDDSDQLAAAESESNEAETDSPSEDDDQAGGALAQQEQADDKPADNKKDTQTGSKAPGSASASASGAGSTKSSDSASKGGNVEIRTDNVNVITNDKSPENAQADKKPATGDNTNPAATESSSKKPAEPAAAAAGGKIRQTAFTTEGDACLENVVERQVRGVQNQFLSCYQKALRSEPEAGGRLMVSWNILTDGTAFQASVPLSDVSSINDCVVDVVKKLRFDTLDGGRCYVRATYQLSP